MSVVLLQSRCISIETPCTKHRLCSTCRYIYQKLRRYIRNIRTNIYVCLDITYIPAQFLFEYLI